MQTVAELKRIIAETEQEAERLAIVADGIETRAMAEANAVDLLHANAETEQEEERTFVIVDDLEARASAEVDIAEQAIGLCLEKAVSAWDALETLTNDKELVAA